MKHPLKFDFEAAARAVTDALHASTHGMRLMRTLCREIGPRPCGSPGIRQAQRFLSQEWRRLGAMNVHLEKVPVLAWKEGPTRFQVLKPKAFSCDSLQAIHSTPGTFEGRLVDGGLLRAEDLQRLGDRGRGAAMLVKGHVATGGRFEPIQKRLSLAEAAGAVAVVLVGDHPRLPSIHFINRANIPVLCVSRRDGERLRKECARSEARVRLRAEGRSRPASCFNLMGELVPERKTRDLLLACAHLDGFFLSPTAMDNLSGVVTMTEVARALAPYRNHFVRTLRIIAFTGEEHGYLGSKQYVRAHAAELDRTRFILSMDCMFGSTARGVAVMWSPPMKNHIAATLKGMKPRVDVRDCFCMSSDYLPFMLAGIPAARPADWHNSFPSWPHTVEDTDARINPAWIRANAAMCARVLLKMLTDPAELPGRRNPPSQVQRLIERDQAAEPLRWQVLLP